MATALRQRCEDLIAELGLADPGSITDVRPLTGGVASDIAKVTTQDQTFCIKFALPKLKVAEDWLAPVHRNRAEYEWLHVAATIAPECAVKVHGRSDKMHGFSMEFLDGEGVSLWKAELLAGASDTTKAAAVGDLTGKIHAASSKPDFDRSAFQNRDDFFALRLEPYLVFTAGKHAYVAEDLKSLVNDLYETDTVLVHGDVSPKNILFRGKKPVILDAECATMGAPEFDVAFCLNHLVLKAQHVPVLRQRLKDDINAFWATYSAHVDWEDSAGLEQRVCNLLPALMLARVDGKSPVEYLNETSREQIRETSLMLLRQPTKTLGEFADQALLSWKGQNL